MRLGVCRSTRPKVGCGYQHRCPRVGAATEFFFFFFGICADSVLIHANLALIWADSARIELYPPAAETDRNSRNQP